MRDFFEKKDGHPPVWGMSKSTALAYCLLLALLIDYSSILAQDNFKIVGYLPHYRFSLNDKIEYDKMTHLCVAFANPDMEGNLSFEGRDVDPVVKMAHRHGTEVLMSIAGGALLPKWEAAWKNLTKEENRSSFIHKIVQYALDHKFQGVDVDLEWKHVDENYSGFVLELRDSLNQYGMLMTAALPGSHRYPHISDEAMYAFDWINLMAYDLKGPWDPKNAGQHAPYTFAEKCIDYWKGQGMAAENLILGVPFYGFDFTSSKKVHSATFKKMVEIDPANAYLDKVGEIYYNGIPTIESKIQLAMDQVNGVMIWELGQDIFDEYSLMSTIYETVQLAAPIVENIQKEEEVIPKALPVVEAFPDTFDREFYAWEEVPKEGRLIFTDLNGIELASQPIDSEQSVKLNTAFLLNGFDFLNIITENRRSTITVMKTSEP